MRFAVLLACLLFAIWPDAMAQGKAKKPSAPGDPPKCDCTHIPALKRDIADSKWLAQAYANKAAELEAKEMPLYRRLGRLAGASDEMTALWNDFNTWAKKTVREEFRKARGYEDTTSVDFDEETNTPDPKQLEAARKQAPCLRIAEAISRHEQNHANQRTPGGALHERPSQLALEEKAQYEDGVAFVQEEVDSLEKTCKGWSGTVTYSRTTVWNSDEVGPTDNSILKNTRRHESNSSYQVEIAITGGSGTRLQSTAIISTAAVDGWFTEFIDAQPCGKTPARLEIITKDTKNYSGNATQELYGTFSVRKDGSYEVSFEEPRTIVEQGTHAVFFSATGYCIPEKNKPSTNSSEVIKKKRDIDSSHDIHFTGRLDPRDPDNLHGTWTKKEPTPDWARIAHETLTAETVITWNIQRHLPPGR
jgi:hypothetical protein